MIARSNTFLIDEILIRGTNDLDGTETGVSNHSVLRIMQSSFGLWHATGGEGDKEEPHSPRNQSPDSLPHQTLYLPPGT